MPNTLPDPSRNAFWRGPDGKVHKVHVYDQTVKTYSNEYFDNTRRGIMYKNGRKISHATRVKLIVWRTEVWFR